MQDLLKAKWRGLSFDTKQFGLHSLRVGGAATAANAGVPDCPVKWHGHWCSDMARDGYVKVSLEALMSVFQVCGVVTYLLYPSFDNSSI